MPDLRLGFSFVEVSVALLVVALLTLDTVVSVQPHGRRAQDVRVAVKLAAIRAAIARHVLEHEGRLPTDAAEIARHVQAWPGEDPLEWRGSHGRGRIVLLPGGIVRLAGEDGQPPGGRDTHGRAYADYR